MRPPRKSNGGHFLTDLTAPELYSFVELGVNIVWLREDVGMGVWERPWFVELNPLLELVIMRLSR